MLEDTTHLGRYGNHRTCWSRGEKTKFLLFQNTQTAGGPSQPAVQLAPGCLPSQAKRPTRQIESLRYVVATLGMSEAHRAWWGEDVTLNNCINIRTESEQHNIAAIMAVRLCRGHRLLNGIYLYLKSIFADVYRL